MEDRIAGFVDLRATGDHLSLNYIVTAKAWRGRGVARDLLAAALSKTESAGATVLALDVFEHNQAAIHWYQKRGFRSQKRLAFWHVAPRNCGVDEQVRIIGMPHAEASHRAFGFSHFTLAHGGRDFTVGRLGNRWFRIVDGELLKRPGALRALRRLESGREFLFHGAEDAMDGGCGMPLLWSIRMGRRL
jgi:predicted GNAT family acetyltransferase